MITAVRKIQIFSKNLKSTFYSVVESACVVSVFGVLVGLESRLSSDVTVPFRPGP